jgi:hypothetical protein
MYCFSMNQYYVIKLHASIPMHFRLSRLKEYINSIPSALYRIMFADSFIYLFTWNWCESIVTAFTKNFTSSVHVIFRYCTCIKNILEWIWMNRRKYCFPFFHFIIWMSRFSRSLKWNWTPVMTSFMNNLRSVHKA